MPGLQKIAVLHSREQLFRQVQTVVNNQAFWKLRLLQNGHEFRPKNRFQERMVTDFLIVSFPLGRLNLSVLCHIVALLSSRLAAAPQ